VLIDRDNFEDVMRRLGVELSLDLQGDGQDILQLRFEEIDDFHPDKIFHQVSLFSDLRDTRRRLSNSQTFDAAASEVRRWLGEPETRESAASEPEAPQTTESQAAASDSILDQILSQSGESPEKRKPVQTPASRELSEFLGKLVRPHLIYTDEAEQSKLIAAVDRATGELMRAILHHPQFQALESAWRGAYLLVMRAETNADLKIFLLDAAKDEISADLKSVGNLGESALYKFLAEKTMGKSGEESWAVVCANYSFNPDVDDTATFMRIAQIAAAAETPFIAHARPQILGIKSLAETPDPSDWRLAADSAEAKLWAMLRALPEAAYLGLAIPRFMARLPYGAKSEPTETFSFEELDESPNHNHYLWANPAFFCGLLLAKSFTASGWETGQGFVQEMDNLPMHFYKENGESKVKPCAELVMTLNAAEKLLDQGLMPLISYRDSDRVRLARFQSIADPPKSLRGKWTS
jgi:type VI secretion system protein ImpC